MRLAAFLSLTPALLWAQAENIPADTSGMGTLSATEFAKGMKAGWNVGNSLEATGGETAWGNPKISQALIDSAKAAGFNAIRLPVAWSQFSNASTFTIKTAWLDRVQEVVDYAIKRDLYVVMNEHWDGGWLQPTNAAQIQANQRLAAIWKQVAVRFRDYGPKLLFAGTNEVMVDGDYGTPTSEYVGVQNGYNQTFVSAVRSTGGRNAYRYLVVQGFNTNIGHAVSFLKIPSDVTANRMMVEVHFYDPYDFTLKEQSTITQWGATATDASKVAGWGNESNVDAQFSKMKTSFGDKGYPVILGEYGTIARTSVSDHLKYRKAWTSYVTASAVKNGIVPFYWDNGGTGDLGMGLFYRNTGKQAYPELVRAVREATGQTSSLRETIHANGSKFSVDPSGSRLSIELAGNESVEASVVDARGRVEATFRLRPGTQSLALPATGCGVRYLKLGAESTPAFRWMQVR